MKLSIIFNIFFFIYFININLVESVDLKKFGKKSLNKIITKNNNQYSKYELYYKYKVCQKECAPKKGMRCKCSVTQIYREDKTKCLCVSMLA